MMQEYSSSYGSSNYCEEGKGVKNSSNLLHSVRKSSIGKACKKAPVAPMAPTPMKVYKVDPINFRELVQHLTGAPEFKPQALPPHHLQSLTPFTTTSLVDAHGHGRDINATSAPMSSNYLYLQELQSEATMGMGVKAQASGLLELNLSSPSYNWCSSFPPMTPDTMSTWELPGRVL